LFFKLGNMAPETHKMLKEAVGDNALCQTQMYEWLKCFKSGWMSVTSGRPSTRTIPKNVA